MSCFNDSKLHLHDDNNKKKTTTIDTFAPYDNSITQSNPLGYTINGLDPFIGLSPLVTPSIGYPLTFDMKIKKIKEELIQLKISVLDNPVNESVPSRIPISLFDADFIVTHSQIYARMFNGIVPYSLTDSYSFDYTVDLTQTLGAAFVVVPTPVPVLHPATFIQTSSTHADLSYAYNGPSGNLITVNITINLDLLRSIFDSTVFEMEYHDSMKTGKAQLKTSDNLTIKNSTFNRYNAIGGVNSAAHPIITYHEYIVLLKEIEIMTITTGRVN
jgi:hypothetical protein